MFDRYTEAPMAEYWSDFRRIRTWVNVELAAAEVHNVPLPVMAQLRSLRVPLPSDVAAEELATGHDVVAFLNVWTRDLPNDLHVWVHPGMTSSDLVDSAHAVRLAEVNNLLELELVEVCHLLAEHALAHWDVPVLGRTHGQAAESTTWGYRAATLLHGLHTALVRFGDVRTEVERAKLSGPVGNFRYSTSNQEADFAHMLGLRPAGISSQTVDRGRFAQWAFQLARIATAVEQLALTIRLGQRWEVSELAEGTGSKQIGSSSMPHKRNPITSEKLCGLARIVRAQVEPLLESVPLWEERDISHSSVDRIAQQTASVVLHHMLVSTRKLIQNLQVNQDIMLLNLQDAGDVVRSASARQQLLAAGYGRAESHRLVESYRGSLDQIAPMDDPEPRIDHARRWVEYELEGYRRWSTTRTTWGAIVPSTGGSSSTTSPQTPTTREQFDG